MRQGPYAELLGELIESSEMPPLGFILTVGMVSNHGNWFTSGDHNKELQVLAQSYDWLLFLTDGGLSQFIDELLLHPSPSLSPVREAFLESYSGTSGSNKFTKVRIGLDADIALWNYFTSHEDEFKSWFNVIAPTGGDIEELRKNLQKLASKKTQSEQAL